MLETTLHAPRHHIVVCCSDNGRRTDRALPRLYRCSVAPFSTGIADSYRTYHVHIALNGTGMAALNALIAREREM